MNPYRKHASMSLILPFLRHHDRRRGFVAVATVLAAFMTVLLLTGNLSGCAAEPMGGPKTDRLGSPIGLDDWGIGGTPQEASLGASTAQGGAGQDGGDGTVAQLVIRHPDGTVTLNSFLPMHLINHLQNYLAQERYDIIDEQLVAESAKTAYLSRGRSSDEILEFLEESRVPILQLLARMPYGINSPSVTYNQAGSRIILRLYGGAAQDLKYTTLEVNRESGQFRLHSIY